MAQYLTTNIRLESAQWKRLKRVAVEEGLSLSGLVREMAETYLRGKEEAAVQASNDSFFAIGDQADALSPVATRSQTTISEGHDQLLYGARRTSKR